MAAGLRGHRHAGSGPRWSIPRERRPPHPALRLPGGREHHVLSGNAPRGDGRVHLRRLRAHIDGPEVHADGEIWVETLWDLRRALVAKHPSDGVTRARALITDGMRLARRAQLPAGSRRDPEGQRRARIRGPRSDLVGVRCARDGGERHQRRRRRRGAARELRRPRRHLARGHGKPPPGDGKVAPARDIAAPRVSSSGSRAGASAWDRAAHPGPARVAVGTRFRFRLSERADAARRIVLSRALSGRKGEGAMPPAHACVRRHPRCTRWAGSGRLARSGRARRPGLGALQRPPGRARAAPGQVTWGGPDRPRRRRQPLPGRGDALHGLARQTQLGRVGSGPCAPRFRSVTIRPESRPRC